MRIAPRLQHWAARCSPVKPAVRQRTIPNFCLPPFSAAPAGWRPIGSLPFLLKHSPRSSHARVFFSFSLLYSCIDWLLEEVAHQHRVVLNPEAESAPWEGPRERLSAAAKAMIGPATDLCHKLAMFAGDIGWVGGGKGARRRCCSAFLLYSCLSHQLATRSCCFRQRYMQALGSAPLRTTALLSASRAAKVGLFICSAGPAPTPLLFTVHLFAGQPYNQIAVLYGSASDGGLDATYFYIRRFVCLKDSAPDSFLAFIAQPLLFRQSRLPQSIPHDRTKPARDAQEGR